MIDEAPRNPVARIAIRPTHFIERIRFLAADTSTIWWSQHARKRMAERGISNRVALTVIREGMVSGPIEAGQSQGEWKAKIIRNVKGRRDVGVVVLLIRNNRILVKTVEWEDVR